MTDTVLVGARSWVPDTDQEAVLRFRGRVLRVLGAPGTGKTRLAVEIVADRVADGSVRPEQCLLLADGRRAAARLRDAVTTRLAATTREPLARTFASFAFGVLRQWAIATGSPTPRLISGPEQDVVLGELLAGHRLQPETAPLWPDSLGEAPLTRGFRAELRDLLMRAVEHGVEPAGLARLGVERDRPEWVAAAQVLEEYDQVTALSRPGSFDPAWLVSAAVDALEDSAELLDGLVRAIRLVVVDDAQEVTASGARLLRLLAAAGVSIVLLGDPDCAVQTFRGGDPRFLGSGWLDLGAGESIVLRTGHRLPAALTKALRPVPGLIGSVAGVGHRSPAPRRRTGGRVEVHVFRSAAAEAGFAADVLRRAHLLHAVPWEQMAVLVRGQGRAGTVRRVLTAAGVPVADDGAPLPVREEEAARPLLQLLRAAAERVAARGAAAPELLVEDPDAGWMLSSDLVVDLLTSPYGRADAVTLRRLRRALRREALAGGSATPADVLLAAAVAAPGRLLDLGAEADGARRIGRMLAAATSALEADGGLGAESALWAIWEAAGVAAGWQAAAVGGGRAGVTADRDLDAVLGLFAAAGDFTDRLPGASAAAFLDHIAAQELGADSIVARTPRQGRVSLLTPHSAAGRQWRLVVVAGVQEGAWPDLRLRGSLLGSEHLVDVLAGRDRSVPAAQAAVRHDEARLFHVAVTRATEQLIVTAVRAEEEQPSPYLDLLDPVPAGGERPFTEVDRPLTLAGTVAALRRSLADPLDPQTRSSAAATLAGLAREGVRGADPASWWGLREPSTMRPRVPDDRPVPVSPSGLVEFGHCRLRWLLTRLGGHGPAVGSAALGTLVHEVLAETGDLGVEPMRQRLEREWGRLGLGSGWTSRARRADAEAMLERGAAYFARAEQDGWVRVGAEVSLRLRLGRAELAGTVDRLERRADGAMRVIDYKTGSTKPKVAEVARHPQLGCYQAAVEAGAFGAGTRSAGAALVQLGKAGGKDIGRAVQTQAALDDDDDPGWATDLVAEAAEAMAAAEVSATAGEWCRTCTVRTSCPVVPEGGSLT